MLWREGDQSSGLCGEEVPDDDGGEGIKPREGE